MRLFYTSPPVSPSPSKEREKVFERGASPLLNAPYVKGEGEDFIKRDCAPLIRPLSQKRGGKF